MALRVSLSESVPDSDMEFKSACSRLGEVRALAQSVIELRWTPFFVLYHAAQSNIFWYDKASVASRLPFKAVAVVSTVAMAARHVCGKSSMREDFVTGKLDAEQNLRSNHSVAGLGREGASWRGQTGPRMDEGSRDMDPRDRYRCVGSFFTNHREVLSQLRDTWHTLWQAMPRSRLCLNCRRFHFSPSATCSLRGRSRLSRQSHAVSTCHFLFRCDEALSGSCQLRKATETSGFHLHGLVSRSGESMPGVCSITNKTPMRTMRCLQGSRGRTAVDTVWRLAARSEHAVGTGGYNIFVLQDLQECVCEMVSHSQLWIQASTLRFPLGFFRFSPVTSLAPAGSKLGTRWPTR